MNRSHIPGWRHALPFFLIHVPAAPLPAADGDGAGNNSAGGFIGTVLLAVLAQARSPQALVILPSARN